MKSKKLPLLLVLSVILFSQIVSAQTVVSDDSDGPFSILAQMVTVLSPNGGENWNGGEAHNITWSLDASITNVNIDYSIDSGNSWTSVAANISNSGTHAWTVSSTPSQNCLVRVSAAGNAGNNDFSDRVFSISSASAETITAPRQPAGPASGTSDNSYTFSSSGANSNFADALQYKFDWGDGTDSGWLATGTTSAAHIWTSVGTYQVRTMARCATHTSIESPWAETFSITISNSDIPALLWNTFVGGSDSDQSRKITVDNSGNTYITGYSRTTWGNNPLRSFSGDIDAFVAKLDANGVLLWNTFLGGSGQDQGEDIIVDNNGNIYIMGTSTSASWGNPLNPFSGAFDAFVVKLNANGAMQWNTFLGGIYFDFGSGIALDNTGNLYVSGSSELSWGNPLHPFSGSYDEFIAKLNTSGLLQWNTFLGGTGEDLGYGIALDSINNIYVMGRSDSTWGSPLNHHFGNGDDTFIAKLDDEGVLQYNTFMGGNSEGNEIAIDNMGNIIIVGKSYLSWGSPLNPFAGGEDAFVAKLNASGSREWHTFLGGASADLGTGVALDVNGNMYVIGSTYYYSWGSPINPYSGGADTFVANLNASGVIQWNTFLGGSHGDNGYGIALHNNREIFVTGSSTSSWGTPLNPFSGAYDGFLAKLVLYSNSLAVLSPNGGENWAIESSQNIAWSLVSSITSVNIDYSIDNGNNWAPVAANIANNGSFPWTMPDTFSTNCLVRVSDAANASVFDVSDAEFTISLPVPTVTVASPNGGENWINGESHDITWSSTGAITGVNIDYSTNHGNDWTPVTANSANSGAYAWTIPATPSTTCLVRISDAANASVFDTSDAVFAISATPTLTLTAPNGSESWMVSTTRNITWTSTETVGNVDIHYSLNNGSTWTSVVSSTANDGLYAWSIPAVPPSTTCLVRIQEAGGFPTDQSDAVFSIIAYAAEAVSTPNVPTGQGWAMINQSNTYVADGSTSNWGDAVEYRFDWGDTTYSSWLSGKAMSASHSWSTAGTYNVRAQARCASHTAVESAWSAGIPVIVFDQPTWVAISCFTVCAGESQPTLEWHTSAEAGVVGFNLLRQDRESKEFARVNDVLLPALASAPQGGVYRLFDPGALPGEPVTYRLEEVDSQGRMMGYGPFTVTFGAASPESREPDIRIGKAEATDIYGYQRYPREQSLLEQRRLNARRQERLQALPAGGDLAGAGPEQTRVTVKGKGLFYVTAAQIASNLNIAEAVVTALISNYNLKLTGLGQEIAWLADRNGAGLFFYNEGKETAYADKNVYFLEHGSGRAMTTVGAGSAGVAPDGQTYQESLSFAEGHYFVTSQEESTLTDNWFWDYIIAGSRERTFALNAPGAAATGQATLKVVLRGGTDTAAELDHHAIITLNGSQIGSAQWDGGKEYVLEASFSASQLADGANSVLVSGALDTGAPYSIFYVDRFELSYPRCYQAVDNSLICRGDGNAVVTVAGFSELDIVALDVSQPESPVQVVGVAPDVSGRVTFVPAGADNLYLLSGLNAAQRPLSVSGGQSGDLHGLHGIEHMVIAPTAFASTAQELADYRQRQGLKSKVVTLEDIYDAYSYGVPNPYAIRDFLAQAYGKKLKYVVLAGKGTYDYKDYLGNGDNLVPALLGKTANGFYAADRIYGDVKGSDGVPEIAIGRLPAVTNAELKAMIDKIKEYESGQGEWTGKALFIADNADGGGDFALSSDELAVLATGFQAEKLYLAGSASELRSQIAAAWNAGAALVSYCGHAGMTQLAEENLLDVAGAGGLQNGGQLPLAVMLTCVAGRFEVPGFTSLGEALLLNANGGMAGGLIPSGAAMNNDSLRLVEAFLKAGLRPGTTVGQALLEAMKSYVQQGGNASLYNVYNWLGDPATEFK